MCLSTVYKTEAPGNALAEYVTEVKVDGDEITFTDITGNEVIACGNIASIDLVKNIILINAA